MLRSRCSTQVCTIAFGHVVGIESGRPLEAVADDDAHISDAAVLDLGEHPEPELGTLARK